MSTPAQPLPAGPVMLDASFLIALLEGDQGAARYADVLSRAVVDAVTLGEVYATLDQRTGIEPTTIEEGLRALGASLVDLPVSAATHVPAVRAAETARRAHQDADSEQAARLPLSDLAVLAHALHAGLPVLTGNHHWATLALYGLDVEIHHHRDRPRLSRPSLASVSWL